MAPPKSHRRALQKEKLVLDEDAQQQLNIAEQKAEVIRLWDK
jgi:hypothetical protein